MKKTKIALLGFGTVGTGVWKILNTNKESIQARCNQEIEVAKILVNNIDKQRSVEVPSDLLTTDFNEILNDNSIDIVVELMGGATPATDYMLSAMKSKKHVVTANKLVLATDGDILFDTAKEEDVLFYYEASVAGGIPVIREINESLTGNKIEKIMGILNGTTNFILSKMTLDNMDFADALKLAQDLGYAEADPTADVGGFDAMYKLAIMANLGFGAKVNVDDIYREGITEVSSTDIEHAKKYGYAIKLLGIGVNHENGLELRVHPTMVPTTHQLANVNDSFNSVYLKGNAVGDLVLYGRGAGDLPTGSAVVGDIISIIRNGLDVKNVINTNDEKSTKPVFKQSEISSKFYIRLKSDDVEKVTAIFAGNDVKLEIATNEDNTVVVITENAIENNVLNATQKLELQSLIRIIEE